MPMYRLGEQIARVYNPMPDVGMVEIVREAGVEGLWTDGYGPAFQLKFVWSQGHEREEIVIDPGKWVELPVSVANLAYSELNGVGLVLFSKSANGEWPEPGSDVWITKSIEGLQKARQFYLMRGSIPLSKARVRHGVQTDEQWNMVKIKFKGGLVNQVREARIEVERKRLTETRSVTRGPVAIPPQKGVAA